MSAIIDAVEDLLIWKSTHVVESDRQEFRLAHWAKTGHVTCDCDVIPQWYQAEEPS